MSAATLTLMLALLALAPPARAGIPCEPAWHPFTSGGQIGVNSTVEALTVWNGSPVAGGAFITAGGQIVNCIARWDGSAWQPFTSGGQVGVGNDFVTVYDLIVWNGDLVAGGSFITAGGQTVNGIARWDGSEWHPFVSGGQIGLVVGAVAVYALTVWNGDLIAGGAFTTAGGQTVNRIARWDGSEWHPFTSGGQIGAGDFQVRALTVWNGDLIAAGSFTTAGGQTVNRIARWDGSAWHPFVSPGGQIGVSGVGGIGNPVVYALTVWNEDLIAGGVFTMAGGQTVNRIARWDGVSGDWQPFTSGGQIGVNFDVWALAVWNGDLVAGGIFTTAGGQTVNRIARWDRFSGAGAWQPFTTGGEIGVSSTVRRALIVWNGDLIAGGGFITAGGQTVNRIARWDGCLEQPCPICPADVNGDGVVAGLDVQAFVNCLLAGPAIAAGCECADMNTDNAVDFNDVADFVTRLLIELPCP